MQQMCRSSNFISRLCGLKLSWYDSDEIVIGRIKHDQFLGPLTQFQNIEGTVLLFLAGTAS